MSRNYGGRKIVALKDIKNTSINISQTSLKRIKEQIFNVDSADVTSQNSKFNIHNRFGLGKMRQGYNRSPKNKDHYGDCIKVRKTKPRHKYGNTVVIDK